MNKNQTMLTRDLLYPTKNVAEPGCIKVTVYKPDDFGSMPVYISPTTEHSPIEYMDTIVKIIQEDIFNRIRINIKDKGIFYIEADDKVKEKYGCDKYLQIKYIDNEKVQACTNEILY